MSKIVLVLIFKWLAKIKKYGGYETAWVKNKPFISSSITLKLTLVKMITQLPSKFPVCLLVTRIHQLKGAPSLFYFFFLFLTQKQVHWISGADEIWRLTDANARQGRPGKWIYNLSPDIHLASPSIIMSK